MTGIPDVSLTMDLISIATDEHTPLKFFVQMAE